MTTILNFSDSEDRRGLIELRAILQSGLDSPFWRLYREFIEANRDSLFAEMLTPSVSIESVLRGEQLKGRAIGLNTMLALDTVIGEITRRIEELEPTKDQPDVHS